MLVIIVHGIGVAFILAGLFFFTAGTLGLIRFPDVLTRMHATTKCDTLGAGLILVGLMFFPGTVYLRLKLAVIIVFLWIANPTAAHYMARAVYRTERGDGDAPGN
ncbi:MAG: Na(+)/H(+) antiporter subunit G [Firmicutes bacterium]|nr:Na(+)/H(+) antiporter subunit G [Bacillota bacterium]MBT9152726.1 Na(+)/H(+) antiporter subunit G [Bacillota bacterium]